MNGTRSPPVRRRCRGTGFDDCGDFLVLEIFQRCPLLRDGHAVSRVCRRFYRLVGALLGAKPRLPGPGTVAFSLSLLRYVKKEGKVLGHRGLSVGEAQAILARDDVEACRNLVAEGYNLKSVHFTDVLKAGAAACLDFLLEIRPTAAVDHRELREMSLQLRSPDCDAALERRGFRLPPSPERFALVAGPERFCSVLGLSVEAALARPKYLPQLARAALSVDDAETLGRCLALDLFPSSDIEGLWIAAGASGSYRCAVLLMAAAPPADAQLFKDIIVSVLGEAYGELSAEKASAMARFLAALFAAVPEHGHMARLGSWADRILRIAIEARNRELMFLFEPEWLRDQAEEVIMRCTDARQACFLADMGRELSIPLLPSKLPLRLFHRDKRHPETVVAAWLEAGGVWYPDLCRLLTRNGHTGALYCAFKNGCACAYVSGVRIAENGCPQRKLGGCTRAAESGDPSILKAELQRRPRVTLAALQYILKNDRADLLAVALRYGGPVPLMNPKARALAKVSPRCRELLQQHREDSE